MACSFVCDWQLFYNNVKKGMKWLNTCFLKNKTQSDWSWTPSLSSIKYWTAVFEDTRIFAEDHPCSPNEVITSEITKKTHDIVINNRRVKMHEIVGIVCVQIK